MAAWEPGRPHEKPDPNRCPSCGEHETLRELAKRHTWQPVTFRYAEDGSTLEGDDYRSFEYGDDVEVTGFECSACFSLWPDVYGLALEQRRIKALDDWAEYNDRLYDESPVDDENVAAEAASESFRHAVKILQGNGEA